MTKDKPNSNYTRNEEPIIIYALNIGLHCSNTFCRNIKSVIAVIPILKVQLSKILIVLYHYCVCSGSNINHTLRDKNIKFAIVFGILFATIAQISNIQLNFLTTHCHILVKWSLKGE